MSDRFSKTKKQLIDVARELFARKGKSHVTMNDIAEASNKGRRTIYTYFSNKNAVYQAVIRYELDLVIEELKKNESTDMDATRKLRNHILLHLRTIKRAVERNGTLRAAFFNDILEVERYRKHLDNTERCIIRSILEEGVLSQEFEAINTETTSIVILYAIKGLEVPYIKNNIGTDLQENSTDIVDFFFKGIRKIQ